MPGTPRSRSPIARRLKEARTRAGISQKRLGIRVGLDASVASARMNQYERGVHEPHYDFVRKLARILKVPVAYFYTEDSALAEWILAFGRISKRDRQQALRSQAAA